MEISEQLSCFTLHATVHYYDAVDGTVPGVTHDLRDPYGQMKLNSAMNAFVGGVVAPSSREGTQMSQFCSSKISISRCLC